MHFRLQRCCFHFKRFSNRIKKNLILYKNILKTMIIRTFLFQFGGKLISFENKTTASQNQQPGQPPSPTVRSVEIHQIITEPELVEKSKELEQALQSGNFLEYCNTKASSAQTMHDSMIWCFIKANFDPNRKKELLNLLGYKPDDVNSNLRKFINKPGNNDISQLSDQLSNMNNVS